jgi:hypothetical protein
MFLAWTDWCRLKGSTASARCREACLFQSLSTRAPRSVGSFAGSLGAPQCRRERWRCSPLEMIGLWTCVRRYSWRPALS